MRISDWSSDVCSSDLKAALAGLDQESGQELDDAIYFGQPFADALAAGRIPAGRLDDMVRRILYGVIASGLMDDPVPESPRQIDYAAHADIAQRAAEEGIDLLKNEGAMLPLRTSAPRVVRSGTTAR